MLFYGFVGGELSGSDLTSLRVFQQHVFIFSKRVTFRITFIVNVCDIIFYMALLVGKFFHKLCGMK